LWSGFSALYRGADADVYRNDQANARAFVPGRVLARRTQAGVFSVLGAADFDPRTVAVAETSSPIPAATGRAVIVRDDAERVDIRANLSRGGLVVLADAFDDGWQVKVDGKRVEQLRVDGVLRGVVVPAGARLVSWRYRTPGLGTGVALSGIGLAAIIGWAVLVFARGRRQLMRAEPGLASDEEETSTH
jgi:Bacterial membrane protein YfhO